LNINSFKLNSVDFWGHNDADMLEIGNGNLTHAESRSHFALWAAMKSPLLIGTALDKLSKANVDILKNKYLLAFNQDSQYGKPAMPYKWGVNPDWTFNRTNPAEYWSGKSSAGTLVLLLNTLDHVVVKQASWAEVPGLVAGASYDVVDAWTGEDLGCARNGISTKVESHDTAVYLVKKGSRSAVTWINGPSIDLTRD
jgi:alpha-galactosidase